MRLLVCGKGRKRRLRTPSVGCAGLRPWKKAIALRLLAGELAHATDGLRPLTHPLLRGLLIGAPLFHLAKDALALHLLFEDTQSLIHIVFTHEHLQIGGPILVGVRSLLSMISAIDHSGR